MAIGGALGQRKFPVSSAGVTFSRMGVLAKQLRSQRKGMGVERERERGMGSGGQESKFSAGSPPHSKSWHLNVRKNVAHKESSQEKSHVQKQSLMSGLNCQAARERWNSPDSGPGMAFIEGGG
jgi:hypothetical protein